VRRHPGVPLFCVAGKELTISTKEPVVSPLEAVVSVLVMG
jgi:hypothetical protein